MPKHHGISCEQWKRAQAHPPDCSTKKKRRKKRKAGKSDCDKAIKRALARAEKKLIARVEKIDKAEHREIRKAENRARKRMLRERVPVGGRLVKVKRKGFLAAVASKRKKAKKRRKGSATSPRYDNL
jgi:hypothetical protein